MLFICPTCGSPEPTSNNTYPFPRVSNDCGPYAVNTIISHITLFDESYIFPTVISPQEFEFYDHSGFPVVIGNTFLPEILFCALSSRFIYPFAPLFQHPHSFQISLLIPSASFGFIIYALSHFYCIIPTTSPDIYTIFDSSGMSISISLSTLSILLQPFYNNSSTTVTLLHCANNVVFAILTEQLFCHVQNISYVQLAPSMMPLLLQTRLMHVYFAFPVAIRAHNNFKRPLLFIISHHNFIHHYPIISYPII
jgi:hypothetical protein